MPPDVPTGLPRPVYRRREVLAGAATAATALGGGCVRSAAGVLGRDAPTPATVTITSMPADDDPRAMRIARYLAGQLEAVGIQTRVRPMEDVAMLREVLMNQEFDLYVAEHPGAADPDFLRAMLHSRFAAEAGWQNPMGYAALEVDDLLTAQRRLRGSSRRSAIYEVQHAVARDQPFSVIAAADALGAFRTDRFAGGEPDGLSSPIGYLRIGSPARDRNGRSTPDSTTPTAESGSPTLRVATTDSRPTESLNPLAAEYRGHGVVTGLLYDPIGRWLDGTVQPWLAESWTLNRSTGETMRANVRLRDGVRWHDGRPLTAADVAFTYRFLRDTSLGRQESPIPTTRFRGPSSLVESVRAVDRRRVELTLRAGSRAVAARALTVPVLPTHRWESRTGPGSIAGIDARETVTEALVWNNLEPVGSGPFRFESVEPRTQVTLSRVDDHILFDDDGPDPQAADLGFERIRFLVVPSGAAGVELLTGGEADVMAAGVEPATIPRIGRARQVQLTVSPTRGFYHLGFNVRRPPFSNPRFRRAVAQLLDKPYLVEQVFDGFGRPIASPLAHHDTLAPALRFDGEDPELPFPGEAGTLDGGRARDAFRDAGYRYSNDGHLLLN